MTTIRVFTASVRTDKEDHEHQATRTQDRRMSP